MKNRKELVLLGIILVISAIMRFFNLMHDSPYFFNPDERNMANAISQFRLPTKLSDIPKCISSEFNILSPKPYSLNPNCNLNPHFFSYGQFPLYLAFASDQISKIPISLIGQISQFQPQTTNYQLTTNFSSAIFWLRFWSAITSVLAVLMVYLIANKIFNKVSQFSILHFPFSILAALMAAFTPGLIQSAHFGTTESLLTFFFLLSIYLSISYLSSLGKLSNLKFIILLSLTIGLALGSKLTGIFFFIPPFIVLAIRIIELSKKGKKQLIIGLFENLRIGLFIILGSILIFILSSPYNLVEPESFRSAVFGYESDVATGKYEAFYTRQFVNTTPMIFQAEKIFPYVLGWPVFILGSLGFILILFKLVSGVVNSILYRIMNYACLPARQELRIKNKKNDIPDSYFLLLTSFLIYLLPNSFLFAKWTRFTTPILPFFAIFAAFTLSKLKNLPVTCYLLSVTLLITPGLAFMSIYTHEDTRVTASKWIYENIPNNSYVLSETANVIDIPLGLPNYTLDPRPYTLNTISFDFYHMDENPTIIFTQLLSHLEKADYIFIPSRRIFDNYTKLPLKYPLVTKYYQLLFSGRLGFEKVTEISSFPKLPIGQIGPISLIGKDESAEETFTVFDHPVIRIYKKNKSLKFEDYQRLFAS